MMREILFRAKRVDNSKWIEGYYVKYESHLNCDCYYGIVPTDAGGLYAVRINPETLCQYICMNDNNGKKIWENDIVSCEHEKYPDDDPLEVYPLLPDPIKYRRNYAVEFVNTGSNYGYRLRNKSIHFMLTGNVIYNHKIEVLGNVFDNPELLKGDQSCMDL